MKDKIRIIPLIWEIAGVIVKGGAGTGLGKRFDEQIRVALSGCGGRVCRCSGGAF